MEPQKYIVTVDQWGTEWCNETGKFHRLNGPAVEYANGTKKWFVNGKRHRLDGPAAEFLDGTKCWWVNGKLHRLDGPAVEWKNGNNEWYIEGVEYTEEQFNEKVKQLHNTSCEGKIVEIEGKKYKLTSV